MFFRATITIDSNIENFKGAGTKENPYVLEFEQGNTLGDKYVGEYLVYNNLRFRIIEKKDENVKIALDSVIKENDNKVELKYGKSNYFNEAEGIGYYLNEIFFKTLENRNDIIKGNLSVGKYDRYFKYDYKNIYEQQINTNVGLLNIGDLFINDVDNYFLMSRTSNGTIYQILENGKIFEASLNTETNIRPTLILKNTINIKSGKGTKDEPWVGEYEK